jgi:hypothetical protein
MKENTHPERPSEVTTAVYMLYLGLGLTAVMGILEYSLPGGDSSYEFAYLAVGLPVDSILYFMIWKGKNWARLTLLTLTVLGILAEVIEPTKHCRPQSVC